MWPFTGGSHYRFWKYEANFLSKIIKNFKKNYSNNIQFVAISEWLKSQAEKSSVLSNYEIKNIQQHQY